MCLQHEVDLEALARFVEDGRPDANGHAPELISGGQCPACQDRYVARRHGGTVVRHANGDLYCHCCRATWSVTSDGWVARLGGGLELVDDESPLPLDVTIDSSSFCVEIFDDVWAIERVLRTELLAMPGVAGALDSRVGETVDDLLEGVVAAAQGKAVEGAEIWRSTTESGLDPLTADTIMAKAVTVLARIHQLLDGAVEPSDVSADGSGDVGSPG